MSIEAVVNILSYAEPELVLDAGSNPVTTLVNSDWTKSAKLRGVGTTATLTITHDANGIYDLTFTPTATGVWFLSYSAPVGGITRRYTQSVQVETAAQADPAAALAAGTVTVVSPVASTGDATVYQGDDQVAAASRSLDWATTSAGDWPDLTDAGIEMQGQHQAARAVTFNAAGSVVTSTGATKAVRVELAHAATAAMRPGKYDIQVIATLAGGEVVTLVAAVLTVNERKGD